VSFSYEINDFFLYSGFNANIAQSELDTESFDQEDTVLIGTGLLVSALSSDIAPYPMYTLTGLSNFNAGLRLQMRKRSEGYTRLRQAGVLRDLPPMDDFGFLDKTKYFSQTVQRTAYNYNSAGEFISRIPSDPSAPVNDLIGPIENLQSFFTEYKNYNFTTIFNVVETAAVIEPDATASPIDNEVVEVLSFVSLNNLKIDDDILDSNLNIMEVSATDLQKASKKIPQLIPNDISDIDDDSGIVFSLSLAFFNYYYTTYTGVKQDLENRYHLREKNNALFDKVLVEKNKQYSQFLENFLNIEKAYRVKIQLSPDLDMKKLSLYGTMDEGASTPESTTSTSMASTGMSSGGGTGGYSY
jgi:hypothetical protein